MTAKNSLRHNHTAVPWNQSLKFRLLAASVFAMLLSGVVMVAALHILYLRRIDNEYMERGAVTARTAARLLDGEMVDFYLNSLEKDSAYEEALAHLDTLRMEHGVQYLYVFRPVEGGALFVWDTDPEAPLGLGEFDQWDANYDVVAPELLKGECVEPVMLDVKWGRLLVTYEPVVRDDGSVAGYVGVDISLDMITQQQQSAFSVFGIVYLLIIIIIVAVNLYIIQKMVIGPINQLVKNAGTFLISDGIAEHEQDVVSVGPSGENELALLERSIKDMELRVNKAMSDSDNLLSSVKKAHEDARLMLQSILNGMEALICICDSETFEILFLNDSIRKNFGIEESGEGQLCYRLLQKLDHPCESCPYQAIHEKPDQVLIWEHHERVKGSVLRKTARLIDWPDGRKAHLEYAIDITELKVTKAALEHQNQLLHTVNHISTILLQATSDTFENDLLRSMGIMGEAAGADRVYIWQNELKEEVLYCSQIFEWSERVEPQQGTDLVWEIPYREIPEWENILAQGLCINGTVSDLTGNTKELLTMQGIITILVVPIFLNEQFWGFVGFDNCHSERVFSESEEKILRSASELIGNALIRSEMEKNIRYLETEVDKIYYDPLTGIYNRRYLDENLKRVILSLSRSGSILSVLMVDIDHFKRFNDTYGHGGGDRCLKIVAKTLRGCITRSDDFVARYGGEEFLVVLPNTDMDGACRIANKILENIRNCAIPHETSDAADCVTVSVGAATGKVYHTHHNEDFIRCADEMLYQSKRTGRNRYSYTSLM